MMDFHHPNVMSLIGVCLDAGPGVSIVMPFMANGSLLDYLKKERDSVYLSEIDEIDEVATRQKIRHALQLILSQLIFFDFIILESEVRLQYWQYQSPTEVVSKLHFSLNKGLGS